MMGETDVSSYSVVDASGSIVGAVEHTEHTAIKRFRITNTLIQESLDGRVVATASW